MKRPYVRPTSPIALDNSTLKAHLGWIERGGRGEGRLELVGLDLRGARLAANLSSARLEKCDLRDCHFHLAQLHGIEFVECRFEGTSLDGCDLEEAVLRDCCLQGIKAWGTDFVAARLTRCDFRRAFLARTGWNAAYLEGCGFVGADLTDSTLDGAQFQRCDFAGASLIWSGSTPLGTAEETQFFHCDFRGADLTDLRAASARFEDCRFHGARAETVFAGGAVLLRPDLTP